MLIYLLKSVIFHTYVSLADGISSYPNFRWLNHQSFWLHSPVGEPGARAEGTPSSPKAQFVLWHMETMEGIL